MEKKNALGILGLSENATEVEIITAIAEKKKDIASKRAAAPTEALQAKFDEVAARIMQAEAVLGVTGKGAGNTTNGSDQKEADKVQAASPASSRSGARSSSGSPLSDTKLADLPGMEGQDLSPVEFNPGTVLANRYEIRELIGQGGMGAVYRAFDKNRDEDIAIKVLLPQLTRNERALERFLNEARVSSKLSHPSIVNVYDVQSTPQPDGSGDLYFLTMELLEGQDLRQIMDNQTTIGRPFEIDDVKEYIAGISEGLAYAHQHTVHRDIKPENIWITEDQQIKLMDFGIAQLQSTSQRTQTGAAMGTAYYMAPEQLKGVKDIDGRADQYALAVLAYELLTGEVPAGAIEPINALRKDIPKGMANAIMQALSPRPDNRFADIQAFNTAIQSGKGAKATRFKSPRPATAGIHSGPNKVVIAAVVLVALFGLGGLGAGGHLDFLKPIDRELLSQQQDQANMLVGQIKTLRKRLDNSLRELDAELKDAERNRLSERHHLQKWKELAETHIENSDDVVVLEGNQVAAEAKLRTAKSNDDYVNAIEGLNEVKASVEDLLARFDNIDSYLKAIPKTEAAKSAWEKFKNTYRITATPQALNDAKFAEKASDNAKLVSNFSEAVEQLQAAENYYDTAQKCCADQVASLKAKWEADRIARERQAREKALQGERLAALKILPDSFSETDYGSREKYVYNGSLSYLTSIPNNNGTCTLRMTSKGTRKYYTEYTKTITREGTTRCRSGERRIDWEPIRVYSYSRSPAYAECEYSSYDHESTSDINSHMNIRVSPNDSMAVRKNGDWVSLTASFCSSGTCKRESKTLYWESSDYSKVKEGLEKYARACGANFSS